MTYRLLADSVVCFHLFFVVFVLCGGFLALRWHPVGWLHLPSEFLIPTCFYRVFYQSG
ncbi:MAG: DUF2784 family protein, partial [Magnetococcales bacterium]|nr:DUF2784 family protein [Magnetococcales bacterium]